MIRIKIHEIEKHRNETSFRPYLLASNIFSDVGIEFTRGDTYDIAWVGQASIADKTLPLERSVEMGVRYCERIGGQYMIFDGQDSHSLIGTYDVLKHLDSNCLLFCKNTLLRDLNMYTVPTVNGRWYWPDGDPKYSIPEIDGVFDRVVLSGTNWLSTVPIRMYQYYGIPKPHDVAALFGYNLDKGTEHGIEHYQFYNAHRKRCVDALNRISGLDIQMIRDGVRLTPDEYYTRMFNSKIIVAPFGYGEIAPRDIEAACFGCVLIKPDMSHIQTIPNIYDSGTYVACKHDYSDLEEKIRMVLDNYDEYQHTLVTNMRSRFLELYTPQNVVRHIYNLFQNDLSDYFTDE